MRESQLRKSVLPLSALMTTGALLLVNSPSAIATPASTSGTSSNEESTSGQVAATATESDTETARALRTATVTVTRKLTPKIKATGRATARANRGAKATASATVTRYAATQAEAQAQAEHDAEALAHAKAAKAAKARAGKIALTRARAVAKSRARHLADASVQSKFANVVLAQARAQRGKPYRWGANGPRAFDCSGYVRYVLHGAGVSGLPRTSDAISNSKKIHRISKAQKKRGDLIFFTSGSHVYHVAIYAGNGMIWHAPGSGRHVEESRLWSSSYRVGRAA